MCPYAVCLSVCLCPACSRGRPAGLLSLLQEEVLMPKGDDHGVILKMHERFKTNKHYAEVRREWAAMPTDTCYHDCRQRAELFGSVSVSVSLSPQSSIRSAPTPALS